MIYLYQEELNYMQTEELRGKLSLLMTTDKNK